MAQTILVPYALADTPQILFSGSPTSIDDFGGASPTQVVGDADAGVCLQAIGDGKYLTSSTANGGALFAYFAFEDNLAIPVGAAINSVQITIRHHTTGDGAKVNGTASSGALYFGLTQVGPVDLGNAGPASVRFPLTDLAQANFDLVQTQTFSDQAHTTAVYTTNPQTGVAWSKSELTGGLLTSQGKGLWLYQIDASGPEFTPPILTDLGYVVDRIGMVVDYVSGPPLDAFTISPAVGSVDGGD